MEQSWWLARLLEGLLVGMLLVAQLFVDMLLLLGLLGMLVVGLLVGLLVGEDDTIRSCKHHQSHSRFGYCHSQGVRERARASNLLIGCPKWRSSK